MIAALDAVARLAGGELEVKHNYGGWRPNLDSPALAALHASYEGLFGEEPIVTAVHAGLETAVIGDKVPGPRHDLVRPTDRGAALARREGFDPHRRTVLAPPRRVRRRALQAGKGNVMRGPWIWVVVILAGLVGLVAVVALVGRDDNKGQTVPAGEWADGVCGSVAVWRGEIESVVDSIRDPAAAGSLGAEEPQSETPQGRTAFIRDGVERTLRATATMITGIDNAGVPDTPQGEQAANAISGWADATQNDLEDAQDSLDQEADNLADAIAQLTDAARAITERGHQRRQGGRRRRPHRPRARGRAARLEHLPATARGVDRMSTMDWILVALQGAVVIGFIALGVRSGGIGLGLWGGVGTLVLVFVFGLDPGEPPISAMLIIIAVISAAAAMQAAGGVDYMVLIASNALRARPKALNFVAPYVSYLLTILTGTSNTFFSIIPVINEVAYANKIRPERALAGSTVANALGITSSPVAAAMATLLPLVEVYNYDLVDVMLITIPASIVGILAMSLVMSRHGTDLEQDAEYQRRLAAGEIQPPAPAAEIQLLPYAKRSVAIFLAAVAAICLFGFVEGIRPTVAAEGGGVEPLSVTPLIQMIMLTAAALMLIFAHVKAADIPSTPIFKSGMVAMIALFGIAWMADTFIANNEDAIILALGSMAENLPVHDRRRDLRRRGPHDEPVGGDANDGPARSRARDRRRIHDRDVDGRRRCAVPAGERHADRRGGGRHDGDDQSRQARRRPFVPAALADLLDRHGDHGDGRRLALLRRSDTCAARADRHRSVR